MRKHGFAFVLFLATTTEFGLHFDLAWRVAAETTCRRWDHQTVVVDDNLYLLGGWKLSREHIDPSLNSPLYNAGLGSPTNEFLSLDLTKPWQLEKDTTLDNPLKWQVIDNYTYITPGAQIPAIAAGGLFTSHHKDGNGMLLYDGKLYAADNATANAKDAKSQLISYAPNTKKWILDGSWSNPGSDATESSKISRYSRGTPVDIPGQNMAFYVGGARSWQSHNEYDWYYPEDIQLAQIKYEDNVEWKMMPLFNNSKTVGAAVTWVPIGANGSLIVVGGTLEGADDRRSRYGKNGTLEAQNVLPEEGHMRSFSETLIYDIAEDKWLSQQTRGIPLPAPRQDACLVSRSFTEPSGNITHQLFFYGGSSGSSFGLDDPMDDQVFFGDLYVLSLPSFRWLRFDEIPNAPNARTRHRCHVVNEHHLFIVGGGRNDSENAGLKSGCVWDELSVLDMNTMEWLLEYTPNKDPYVVNDVIRGDSLVQGIPRTEPEAGWSTGVDEWFQSQYKPNSAENSQKRSKLPLIIGVVVGCFVAAGIFLIARLYYRHRRNKAIATAEVIGFKSDQIGITSGTQALPQRGQSDSLNGRMGPNLSSGRTDVNPSIVIEMPADSAVARAPSPGGNTGWNGSGTHSYTPLSTIVDDSGPYLTPGDGPSFAVELDTTLSDRGIYDSHPASHSHAHGAAHTSSPTQRTQSPVSGVSSPTMSPITPSTPWINSQREGSQISMLSSH